MRWYDKHSQRMRKTHTHTHTATFPLLFVKPGMFSVIQVDLSTLLKTFDYTVFSLL